MFLTWRKSGTCVTSHESVMLSTRHLSGGDSSCIVRRHDIDKVKDVTR